MTFIGYLKKDGYTIRVNFVPDGTYVLEWTKSAFVKREQRTIPNKEKLLEILNKRFDGDDLLEILNR